MSNSDQQGEQQQTDTPQAKPQPPAAEPPARPTADPQQTRLLQSLAYTSPWIACRFDPAGNYLFAAAEDFSIQRYELAALDQPPTAFPGVHDSWVRALGCTPDGQTLLTGGYDGRLCWWPATADQPEPLRTVDAHTGWIRALAVSPDGQLLATCGNDRLVRLWHTADGRLVHELSGHESHVYQVAFDPQGQRLASVDLHGHLRLWQLADGQTTALVRAESLHKYDTNFMADIGGSRGLAFDASGRHVAASGITNVSNAFAGVGEPIVVCIDLEAGKIAVEHRFKTQIRGVAWNVCWHPDGYWLAVSGGGGGGYLLYWKPGAQHEFHNFKLPNTGRDFDLHPDGLRLAVAHGDKQLRLYTLAPQDA